VDPANGQVHYNLGEIARVKGDPETARREYTSALADPATRERAQARLSERP
jgi:Flp pilus assembly protein TadD